MNRFLGATLAVLSIATFAGAAASYASRLEVQELKRELGGTVKTLAERLRDSEAALEHERVMVANLAAKQCAGEKGAGEKAAAAVGGDLVRPAGADDDKAAIK